MSRTLWKKLEYIQNYSRIMLELIKLSKMTVLPSFLEISLFGL